ncbi:MAG: hypothetical protein ABIS67_07735, partial [Candidatus Eisenbacteria bacterium]
MIPLLVTLLAGLVVAAIALVTFGLVRGIGRGLGSGRRSARGHMGPAAGGGRVRGRATTGRRVVVDRPATARDAEVNASVDARPAAGSAGS